MKLLATLFILYLALPLAQADIVDPKPGDSDKRGLELGNADDVGRKMVENVAGRYGLNAPENWDIGISESFTEIIAPLKEGTPRNQLQLNHSVRPGIINREDLIKAQKEQGWSKITVLGMAAIKKESRSNNPKVIELKIIPAKEEVLEVKLTGKAPASEEEEATSAFGELKRMVGTLKVNLKPSEKPDRG